LLGTEEARSEEWDDALFILMDRDNDGTVDFREMICALSTLCRGSLEQRLALAFEAFDTDCSGFLEQDECDRMVALLDAHAFDECDHSEGRGLSQLAVKLKLADANGDGKLSFDEVGEERREEERSGCLEEGRCKLVLALRPIAATSSHTLPLSRARALSLTLPQFIAACEHDPEMQHAFGCRIPIDLKEHYALSKQTAAEQGGCAADCSVM
jgi:Ca2+-binding EF-hand superfamily protein